MNNNAVIQMAIRCANKTLSTYTEGDLRELAFDKLVDEYVLDITANPEKYGISTSSCPSCGG